MEATCKENQNTNQKKQPNKPARKSWEREEGGGKKGNERGRRREPKLPPSSKEALVLGKQRKFRERERGFREGLKACTKTY